MPLRGAEKLRLVIKERRAEKEERRAKSEERVTYTPHSSLSALLFNLFHLEIHGQRTPLHGYFTVFVNRISEGFQWFFRGARFHVYS